MNSSNAPPKEIDADKSEASNPINDSVLNVEAALLAIAGLIEWTRCRDLWLGRVIGSAPSSVKSSGDTYYQVVLALCCCNFWDGKQWRSFGENGEWATSLDTLKRFFSDDAAKAACERHFATGKWDSEERY